MVPVFVSPASKMQAPLALGCGTISSFHEAKSAKGERSDWACLSVNIYACVYIYVYIRTDIYIYTIIIIIIIIYIYTYTDAYTYTGLYTYSKLTTVQCAVHT